MDGNPVTVMSGLTSTTTTTHGDSRTDPNQQGSSDQGHSHCKRRCQGGCGNNRTPQSWFKSSVEGLEEAVYDSGLPNSSQDLFTPTTEQTSKYVAKHMNMQANFTLGSKPYLFLPLRSPLIQERNLHSHNNRSTSQSMKIGTRQNNIIHTTCNEFLPSYWDNAVTPLRIGYDRINIGQILIKSVMSLNC